MPKLFFNEIERIKYRISNLENPISQHIPSSAEFLIKIRLKPNRLP